jgi:hypothetical protein
MVKCRRLLGYGTKHNRVKSLDRKYDFQPATRRRYEYDLPRVRIQAQIQ